MVHVIVLVANYNIHILHEKKSSQTVYVQSFACKNLKLSPLTFSADRERERERETVARSPDENDKTELLKEAEPIDYTGELSGSTEADFSQGYQRSSTLRSAGRFSSRTSNSAPPRGIFDDV